MPVPVLEHRSAISTILVVAVLSSLVACSSSDDSEEGTTSGATYPGGNRVDVPIEGATDEERDEFFEGDRLFDVPLREADGLGPLYTRTSCGACHEGGLRGAGSVQKMAVVLGDNVTTSPDQSLLPWGNTVHPLLTAGATTPILPPDDPSVRVSVRVGPPILGRGYMEAVLDSEILRVEAEQEHRTDGIHGRANHVVYISEANPDPTFNSYQKGDMVIGRFGLKARQPTLDDFVADALQGDMGITSPLRPTEFQNPDGLTDDLKEGVDATADDVNQRAQYMRLTAIPDRDGLTDAGRALFEEVQCSVCHVPTLKTRPDYPISLLAGIDAPIYSDLLLHDMGDALADGVIDGEAQSRDWRTAPLIGLRFNKIFLHDGRVQEIEDAILLHGGEASESMARYKALSAEDHDTLLTFVSSL